MQALATVSPEGLTPLDYWEFTDNLQWEFFEGCDRMQAHGVI